MFFNDKLRQNMMKKYDKTLTSMGFFKNFFNFLYIEKKDIISVCRIDISIKVLINLLYFWRDLLMNIRFSERAAGLKASEIRELLKLTEMPEIISFAGGLPAPELFPVEEMKGIMQEVLDTQGRAALQYSSTEGYKPLREIIANERMKPAGVNVSY